jgi:Pro-Pro endopeptidase
MPSSAARCLNPVNPWAPLALAGAVAALLSAAGCGSLDASATDEQDSRANGVDCEVRLDALATARLHDIPIQDPTSKRIDPRDRIRHLNELALLPEEMLATFRERGMFIALTGGTVVNFAEFRSLRGTAPRGWEGTGLTWDSVPGTGNAKGVYLGDSSRPNNAWSLAIHEATHAVDLSVGFSKRSTALQRLYREELARAPVVGDGNAAYRRSNIEEFLAVAVDELRCSTKTRTNLQVRYPAMYSYLSSSFEGELRTSRRTAPSP